MSFERCSTLWVLPTPVDGNSLAGVPDGDAPGVSGVWKDSLFSEMLLIVQPWNWCDLYERNAACSSSFCLSPPDGLSPSAHSSVTAGCQDLLSQNLGATAGIESGRKPGCWAHSFWATHSPLLTCPEKVVLLKETGSVKTGHKSLKGHSRSHWAGQRASGQDG